MSFLCKFGFLALVLGGCAEAGVDPGRSDLDGALPLADAGPPGRADAAPPLPPDAAAEVLLSHSTTNNISAALSVRCETESMMKKVHGDNGYLRVFDLPALGISQPFEVTRVEVGIQSAEGIGGSQPASVRLFTLGGALSTTNLELVHEEMVTVSDQSQSILSVPVAATIPAGKKLVVEFFSPSAAESGHSLWVGFNSDGQSAPSYVRAAGCDFTEPTDLATVTVNEAGDKGDDMHLVLNVAGQM